MNCGGDLETIDSYFHPDIKWHGFRPLRHLSGVQGIWYQFWQPLLNAMPDLKRLPYHFISGKFEENAWVCGTGDFIGTFATDWVIGNYRVPTSGSSIHFCFGEFLK